ncbi:MAG: adenosylcobinamide-phosphate synthase CbiB [Allorhizobium sp.]
MSAGILAMLVAALVLDRLVGDPPWLWSRLSHPVVVFGAAIRFFDRWLNRTAFGRNGRRFAGAVTITLLLIASLLAGALLHRIFWHLGLIGAVLEIIVAAIFLAQKSLSDHVLAVAVGLRDDGLAGGRRAVALIVGRDPDVLDQSGICRGAIESLAENFADGVVAPAFWYAVLGLPGILAYKMLNTADSMIGHKNERYLDFGWASARLDDLANWPAARLSSLLVAAGAAWRIGGHAARRALVVTLRDHGLHRSPNAGWPEAAMAGALDIQLAGPRSYGGRQVSESRLNGAGREALSAADIEQAVVVFNAACSALAAVSVSCMVILLIV